MTAGAAAGLLMLAACTANEEGPSSSDEPRPNILIIMTDDQHAGGALGMMPKTRDRLVRRGITYKEGYTTLPVCCPSRATLMTGQYAHNHGVKDNFAVESLDQSETMQAELRANGYQTSIFGKFLNEWNEDPPNFDRWVTIVGPGRYQDAGINDQGKEGIIEGYSTDILRRKAVEYLEELESGDEDPWFMLITPSTPHYPHEPAARDEDTPIEAWDRNPAMLEKNRFDKPPYVRERSGKVRRIAKVRREQLLSLVAADRLVAGLDAALERLDERRDTLVLFFADNGYAWGEHGLHGPKFGKNTPYTPSIHTPFFLRWPGEIPAGATSSRLVTNVDLAATVYDATGVEPGHELDGRSLLDETWDREFVFLHHFFNPGSPEVPAWASIRTRDHQYVEYYDKNGATDFLEYYDHETDPWQLKNLLGNEDTLDDPDVTEDAELISRLRTCHGISGDNPCP